MRLGTADCQFRGGAGFPSCRPMRRVFRAGAVPSAAGMPEPASLFPHSLCRSVCSHAHGCVCLHASGCLIPPPLPTFSISHDPSLLQRKGVTVVSVMRNGRYTKPDGTLVAICCPQTDPSMTCNLCDTGDLSRQHWLAARTGRCERAGEWGFSLGPLCLNNVRGIFRIGTWLGWRCSRATKRCSGWPLPHADAFPWPLPAAGGDSVTARSYR
jgi:hypothetical protein